MTITADVALNAFVGFALLAVASVILAVGRRREDGIFLAAFLALVGGNFLLLALAYGAGAPVAHRLAFLLLALDPVYLLLFVRAYPYRRRSRASDAVLAIVCSVALVSVGAILLRPELFLTGTSHALYAHPLRAMVVANVVFAYASAWCIAVRTAARAPTRELAQRAAWLVVAAGVALVPRVGLVHVDLRVAPFFAVGQIATLQDALSIGAPDVLTFATLAGITYASGWVLARAAEEPNRRIVRRALALVGAVLAALVLARIAEFLLPALLPSALSLRAAPYTMRWIVFALVLAYGILAYEVVTLRGAVDRVLAGAGAAVAGIGVTLAYLATAGDGAALIAAMLGFFATAPAFLVGRWALRALERKNGPRPEAARRLELYRASLESAWAQGAPDEKARRRLERERREFGVTYEEARALEVVVAGSLSPGEGVAPGDEPAPGIVVERALGEGGHAAVYLARDHATGERVVVKVMRADPGEGADARRRLLRELTALRGLAHPHVVRLRDVHAHGGRYLLVLDHVDGPSLDQVLAKGPLPPKRVARVALDILDALHSVHRRGLVHRDIKPSNILLAPKGRAMLADFGIAATLHVDERPPSTTVSSILHLDGLTGTLRYMAPEQVTGARLGPATDVYQLGLTLYEALAGRPALAVDGLATFDALSAAARPDIPLDGLPPAWALVLARALAPEPEARYPSAEAMRRDVLEIEAQRALTEARPGTQAGSDRPSARPQDADGAAL